MQLFRATGAKKPAVAKLFHLMRRRGEPLLLIPAESSLVRESLSLYPAQTWRARLAQKLAGVAIWLHLPGLTEQFSLPIDPEATLVRFAANSGDPETPHFALLFGNPHAAGRRFIMLVFDRSGRPTKVIKIGMGAAAMELIRREADFLATITGKLTGIPKLLGTFQTTNTSAVAFGFVEGVTPSAADRGSAAKLLGAWLARARTVTINELPAWQRLRQGAGAEALFQEVAGALLEAPLHPAILHGDFAPWNIRANPRTREWTVLDWERGEAAGPPAWDLFHFVIQPMLLVAKLPADQLAEEVERFLSSPEFGEYAAEARIKTIARPLVLAYLLYCREVLKPAEGNQVTRELLELLRQRWRPI